MADNVAVTAGSGTSIATDDIGGVHHQRVKLSLGADGAAVDAVAGAGAVSSAVQRVTLASDDPAVALLGTIDADTSGIITAVQIMDDWDESDRAKVNLIAGQVGITGGSGAIAANTPRVALATDSPGVTALGQTTASASLPVVVASDQSAVPVVPTGATTGGLSVFRSLDLDETEEAVKATAGQMYSILFYNAASSLRYLKFYNDTVANVSVGSTTPVITLPLPATTAGSFQFGGHGIAFSAAITAAATTALADADTGAPSANDVIVNVFYK